MQHSHRGDQPALGRLAPAFSRRAEAYRAQGDLDAAIADLDRAIKLDPRKAENFLGRGSAYLRREIPIAPSAISVRPSVLTRAMSPPF